MRNIRRLATIVAEMGINPVRFVKAIIGTPIYINNYIKFIISNRKKRRWTIKMLPVLADRYEQSGVTRSQYFHMDLWAARLVNNLSCQKLVDVGSRIDGYVAHVLSFRDIEVFDVRPLESKVDGLSFRRVDMSQPNATPLNYADCVTSLHALEHFGLGRYGDDLNLDGWIVGLSNLARLLKHNGHLILAVPIGIERIEFDAHRVFNIFTILNEAENIGLRLASFSYIDDNKDFHNKVNPKEVPQNLQYGCGCFHFILDKIKF